MTDLVALVGNHGVLLLIGLVLATCAALYDIRVLRARCRRKDREIERYRDRESQRARYCETAGHDLDSSCLCTRCLAAQHSYESSATRTIATGSELVNPRADPGALYLDSTFQPDWDYGLTQTIYETETTSRCTRCSGEKTTRTKQKVIDER